MVISQGDIIALLLWVIGGSSALLAAVLGFLGRALVNRIASLEKSVQNEMRAFDRRMTRVEVKLGLDPDLYIGKPLGREPND